MILDDNIKLINFYKFSNDQITLIKIDYDILKNQNIFFNFSIKNFKN